MRPLPFLTFLPTLLSLLSLPATHSLKIACSQEWIEHTPLAYAASHFFNGTASIISGGVPNLRSDPSLDLAANAETQGLKFYARGNDNYRLIGIIVEVTYRLVANRKAGSNGIRTLADLRGKRIGTIPGTSAEVFIHALLASAGVSRNEYTTVSGNWCMREPCGQGTFPAQFRSGQIDAFGVWETSVELGIRALGEENVVVFKNASVYREVYSLYSTTEKLRDARVRGEIVRFVRALGETYDVYRNASGEAYGEVGRLVGVDVPVLRSVWEDHVWGPGSLGEDLLDYLEWEDEYLAEVDRRQRFSRAELERFVDRSVYEEAAQGE